MQKMNTEEILKTVCDSALDKKAEGLKIIDISKISILADYMVIISGANKNQIQAICDNIMESIHKQGIAQKSIEGYDSANWILIDLSDIVIHIFDKESRGFYDLEHLYQDGKFIEYQY